MSIILALIQVLLQRLEIVSSWRNYLETQAVKLLAHYKLRVAIRRALKYLMALAELLHLEVMASVFLFVKATTILHQRLPAFRFFLIAEI